MSQRSGAAEDAANPERAEVGKGERAHDAAYRDADAAIAERVVDGVVRRGAGLFELGTLGMIDADSEAALPTQLIDAFARAASRRDLEEAIARRLEPEVDA